MSPRSQGGGGKAGRRHQRNRPLQHHAPRERRPVDEHEKMRIPSGRGGWRAYLITVGLLMLLWIMLWGSLQPSLLLVGLTSAVLVLWLFPLPHTAFEFGLHPVATVWLVLRFLYDVVVSSVGVAWIAIRPRQPQSIVIRVVLAGTTDLLQHLTALAVSLVPGSLIIEADTGGSRDDGERSLLIHVLDADDDSEREVTGRVLAQERRITMAFGNREARQQYRELTGATAGATG